MGKQLLFLIAAVLIQTAASSSPAFLWNVDNTFPSTSSLDEFAKKLAAEPHLAIFVQDELSVEDFSVNKASLPGIRQLSKTFESKMAFVPILQNSAGLVQSLKENGYQIVTVKANDNTVPQGTSEKVAYVVRLPETAAEQSRTSSLKKNDEIIKTLYGKLQQKVPKIAGIFVGKQNPMDSVNRRVSRSLLSVRESFPGELYNASGEVFLFIENYPELRVYSDQQTIYNFTLGSPHVLGMSNGTEAHLSLSYPAVTVNSTTELSSANVNLFFTMKRGKWSISSSMVNFTARVNNVDYRNSSSLKPFDTTTPRGFSYHCSRSQSLAPARDERDNAWAYFVLHGFQLQPFAIKRDRFGDWYDCEGFFSVGIWAGILLGLMFAAILAWAVSMLSDIRTPDRFDDPKGKTITINATD